jgi:biopolymer transport protein TolR
MKLTPTQKKYIERRVRQPDADPSELGGELNIIPFLDIVVNLIMFLLVTVMSAVAVSQVAAQLPSYDGRCSGSGCGERSLSLSVTVTPTGMIVAGSGGILSPGCTDEGASTRGATVAAGDYDGLTECLRRVKSRFPDEDAVILSADPLIPYAELVRAMDASRADASGPLFPNVLISAGVR